MPQILSAVVVNAWRSKLAQIYKGSAAFSLPTTFKIGEGGWTNPGGGKEPIPPNIALINLSAPTYPVGSQFVFTKALTGGDLTFTSSSRLEINCLVSASEANNDGSGNPPEFFELGVFDAAGTMLVYSTFPIEIKTSSKSLQHVIFVDF